MDKWKYFTDTEVWGLNENFVRMLEEARKIAGIPFVITSGLRTPEANKSIIGAVPDSSHLKGMAVDLRVSSSHEVALIIDACVLAGINRRGIYVDKSFSPVHIHVDVDETKPYNVIFVKQEMN